MVSKEEVIEALKNCEDPEIHIDVWTLGLIYDLQIKESGIIYIKMTLTTPFCPYGDMLINDIKEKVCKIAGVKSTEIELTFEPPWQPSEELKQMMFG
ncbi:MAG: metal-sulfur cluster assembly factor [DPANN group archaeon]|nr:metal-sulfur cluster assembly factor [DPANN group archaeon]